MTTNAHAWTLRDELTTEGNACTFTKPAREQSLPAAGHSEPRPHGPEGAGTVYFLRPGTCTIIVRGRGARFSTAMPSVCEIVLGSSKTLSITINGRQLPPSAVHFLAPGTCTIDVKSSPWQSSPGEETEVQQSFTVGTS